MILGSRPSRDEEQHIATVVERYYRAASVADGNSACSLMYPILADSVPEDYGSGAGPAYLRANSCGAVMTKLFRYERSMLTAPLLIVLVRVEGLEGRVLIGSTAMSARFMRIEKAGRQWKIDSLLGAVLP